MDIESPRWPARALASLFGSGSILVFVSCALPGRTAPEVALAAALVAGVVAVALFASPVHLPRTGLSVVLGLGSVLITVVIASSGRQSSPDALLYVWVALYAGSVLTVRQITLHVAIIAVLYGGTLNSLSAGGGGAAQNLLLVVGAVVTAAVWVAYMRRRIDELVARNVRAARTDALTGLPNRTALYERGDAALVRLGRDAAPMALVLIDLDDFKGVNDSLGHAAGDELLRAVAARLVHAVPAPPELVARLGGDEFAVLLVARDDPLRVAEALSEVLRLPITVEGTTLRPRASLGVVAAEAARLATLDDLLRDADAAMYAAKDANGGVATSPGRRRVPAA